jgi:hypothetical protein
MQAFMYGLQAGKDLLTGADKIIDGQIGGLGSALRMSSMPIGLFLFLDLGTWAPPPH